ncbi:hypothetical protein H920_17889 [Fukomys damarensis]|uniref:Uncharacterized protein n=1 Tax=Fukomys damarensis TaxID=885580 RepID=A0A091DD75_FUKDA|nr:hypothetical protein H920_17889 [Fukomys damarensis]
MYTSPSRLTPPSLSLHTMLHITECHFYVNFPVLFRASPSGFIRVLRQAQPKSLQGTTSKARTGLLVSTAAPRASTSEGHVSEGRRGTGQGGEEGKEEEEEEAEEEEEEEEERKRRGKEGEEEEKEGGEKRREMGKDKDTEKLKGSATCLITENLQDCRDETSCAKELDPPECTEEATQPEKGKDTCVCHGPGRVFQPSDSQCPCLPGYQDTGKPMGCVQREHKSCQDGTTRNQEGLCLTKDQWSDHCAHEDFYLLDRPSSPRSVGHPCNLDQGQKSVPLYVVKVDGKLKEQYLTSHWSLNLNSTHPEDLSPPEPGIQNPTVCLQTNDTLAFLVTREHYPEYDVGHFYNTLEQFDWGRFRTLAEESPLSEKGSHLFLQQFQLPGVYIFHLSSNQHRKMLQCHSLSWARRATPHPTYRIHQQGYNLDAYTSPRTGIISVRRGQSQQDSDAPRVEGGHGWSWEAEKQVDLEWFDTEAFFGILLQQSLAVTTKLSQTKEEWSELPSLAPHWPPDLQLHPSPPPLGILHPFATTAVLLFPRILWSSQRKLGVLSQRPLSLRATAPSDEETELSLTQVAEAVARAAEEEARRRAHLAAEYAASLSHQLKVLHQDLRARQQQWASFCSALMEAKRLLKAMTGSRPQKSSQGGQNPERVAPQMDTVLDHLSQALMQEGHRLKAWGFLGTGTGAELLRPALADPQGGADDIRVNPVTKLLVPGPNCAMLPASGHAGPIPPGYFIHPDTGHVLPEAGHLGYDLLSTTLVPTTDSNTGGIRTSEATIIPYVPYPTCSTSGSLPATDLPILQPRRTSQLGALMTDPMTGIERRVIAVLQQCQENSGWRVQEPLEAAIKDMRQALALSLHHILQQARRLARQLEAARGIEASCGRMGMMCYPGTQLWIPVLYGMEIPDPEGSGLMVPILGMQQDGNSGNATPLAGSMEDADGKVTKAWYPTGLVPISFGARAIDPLTGEHGPVIGAQVDPFGSVVVPVVQVLEALPRGVRNPGLWDLLERELRARQQYWHHQEQEEERLVEYLGHLSQELHTPGHNIRLQLKAAKEACAALESCCLQETERRARAVSMLSNPERGLLSQGGKAPPRSRSPQQDSARDDANTHNCPQVAITMCPFSLDFAADRQEWEEATQVTLGMQKVLQSLEQAAAKLRQASDRLQGQEEEMWLQQARNQNPQTWNYPRKVIQHLSDEFQKIVRKRQNVLDRARGQLQYRRELSRLHILHTQVLTYGLDKVDTIWASPFSILKKTDIWSQGHMQRAKLHGQEHHERDPKSFLQDLLKLQTMPKKELITVQTTDLSAREFVIYQYGLSVLHLLIPQLHAPEITLQIATHLPAMEASGNAFQGSFFYQGLKAYFRDAFSTTLQMSAVAWDSKLDQSLSAILLEEQPISEREKDVLSKLIERKHERHLEPESSEEAPTRAKAGRQHGLTCQVAYTAKEGQEELCQVTAAVLLPNMHHHGQRRPQFLLLPYFQHLV